MDITSVKRGAIPTCRQTERSILFGDSEEVGALEQNGGALQRQFRIIRYKTMNFEAESAMAAIGTGKGLGLTIMNFFSMVYVSGCPLKQFSNTFSSGTFVTSRLTVLVYCSNSRV